MIPKFYLVVWLFPSAHLSHPIVNYSATLNFWPINSTTRAISCFFTFCHFPINERCSLYLSSCWSFFSSNLILLNWVAAQFLLNFLRRAWNLSSEILEGLLMPMLATRFEETFTNNVHWTIQHQTSSVILQFLQNIRIVLQQMQHNIKDLNYRKCQQFGYP